MTIVRLFRLAPLIVALASCGSASAPSQPVQIGGAWSGALESSNFPQQGMTLSLTESGSAISGTWSSEAFQWSGAITGAVDSSSFSGVFTINAPAATGGICTGTATVSGTASPTVLTWTSPGFTGPCGGFPSSVRIVAQRR